MMRHVSAISLAALALSCGPSFKPGTFVEGLRVLSVRAEPPDLAPGQSTRLTSFVVNTSAPRDPLTLLYLACDPDPAALERGACTSFDALSDPSTLAASAASGKGIRVLGVARLPSTSPGDDEVTYTAPAHLFDALAPENLNRRRGVLSLVLLLAIAAPPPTSDLEQKELLARVQTKEVASVLAVKRLRISEDPSPNRNPKIVGVTIDGQLWTEGQPRVKVRPGQVYTLAGNADATTAEHFTQLDADGKPEEKDEKLIFSWFITSGVVKSQRTPAEDAIQEYHPGFLFEPPPADGRATMYTVLRDGRGGAAFAQRGLFICDPVLPPPTLTSVTPASGKRGTRVTIKGVGLKDALDVQIASASGTTLLEGSRYDAGSDAFVGTINADVSSGVPGAAPFGVTLIVRGKSCLEEPQLAFEVTP